MNTEDLLSRHKYSPKATFAALPESVGAMSHARWRVWRMKGIPLACQVKIHLKYSDLPVTYEGHKLVVV